MKKFILLFLIVTAMTFSICACADKKEDSTADATQDSEEKTQTAEVDDTGSREAEEQEIALIKKYLDVDAYKAGDGCISTNIVDNVIDEATIDGITLKIGMSYDEVLAAGFTPDSESFAEEIPGGLAVLNDFQYDDNKSIKLGFIADGDKTVSEGTLYSIRLAKPSSFAAGKITESTKLPDIISVLGEPYRIDTGVWSDYNDMQMKYHFKDSSVYLTFYMNLDTEEIISATLEGHASSSEAE